MTRNVAVILCAAAVLAASCRRDEAKGDAVADLLSDTVTMVRPGDPEMRSAMTHARSTLPVFWNVFDAPPAGAKSFAVKVPVTDPAGTEFFWLVDIQRARGRVSGRIDNRPNIVRSVLQNQRIEVGETEIVDWQFIRDDRIHGNFTLRALLGRLPPRQAEQLKAVLSEP